MSGYCLSETGTTKQNRIIIPETCVSLSIFTLAFLSYASIIRFKNKNFFNALILPSNINNHQYSAN